MGRQMWPCPGNEDASLVATLPSSRMGRCAALLGRHFVRTSGARKETEACAWCMQEVTTVAAPVLCVSSVNGMAKPLANRAFVSVLLRPLVIGGSPLLWRDWSRREHRRACMQLVRDQHIKVRLAEDPPNQSRSAPVPSIHTLAQRAHFRLSWAERLTRNARAPAQGQVRIQLFGVPDNLADFLGLRAA